MEWLPGKEQQMARYKDPARNGHDITFVTKDRLLRAVGNDFEDIHYMKATEPERVGSPDTHLLILLGRKRGWVSDAAMANCGFEAGTRHGQPARPLIGTERRYGAGGEDGNFVAASNDGVPRCPSRTT